MNYYLQQDLERVANNIVRYLRASNATPLFGIGYQKFIQCFPEVEFSDAVYFINTAYDKQTNTYKGN